MTNYRRMYLHLFNAVSDALEDLEHSSAGSAIQRLKDAQLVCEEIYLDTADDEFDDWADADEE